MTPLAFMLLVLLCRWLLRLFVASLKLYLRAFEITQYLLDQRKYHKSFYTCKGIMCVLVSARVASVTASSKKFNPQTSQVVVIRTLDLC